MSLVIKAFLERNGVPNPEIRRFAVPADASASYTYIFKKVSDVFPGLVTGNFNLYWKDADSDLISLSSDDELMEALGFVTDSVFRIYVKEHAGSSSSNSSNSDNTDSNNVHPNVVCDGCEGQVSGTRYKCCVCPDYDLCSQCEAKNVHPEHDMWKIVAPFGPGKMPFRPPPHFRRWMRRFMNRWHNRNGDKCGTEAEDGAAPKCDEEPTNADEEKQGETTSEEEYLNGVGEDVAAMLDPFEIPPETNTNWVTNNTGNWPQIQYEDIIDYLIKSNSFDSKEMKAFRATYAYNYIQNGWLGDVISIVEEDVHYLKACVSPSQPGASALPYSAWIAAGKDGTVLNASCTCPAGHGSSCSHVAAIMYAVHLAWLHGYAGKSCTDLPCAWGRGTESNNLLNELKSMNFKHPKRSDNPRQASATPSKSKPYRFKQFVSAEDFTEHVKKSPLSPLCTLQGTLLQKTLSATENLPSISKETDYHELTHGTHDIDYSKTVTQLECSLCQEFYDTYVKLSGSKRKELTSLTLNQGASASMLWKDSRRVRISASKANSVPKTSRGDPEKFLNNHLYERFKGNENTSYGVTHEPKARSDYEDVSGKTVTCTGTVVSPQEPFLSASPDGIVDESTILEIKCPTTSVYAMIDSGKGDVRQIESELLLYTKGRNGYFTQVQMCMFCTESDQCKFFMWRPEEHDRVLLDVPYDSNFVDNTVSRLRTFYFKHMLVRLVDDFKAGRFVLSEEYKRFCD